YAQYAIASAAQAMADAGLTDLGNIDPDRVGVILGSGIGGLKSFEEQHDIYRERGASKISPFFIPMFIADIAAGIVSMRFNAKGPNYATVSACATSTRAGRRRRAARHAPRHEGRRVDSGRRALYQRARHVHARQ